MTVPPAAPTDRREAAGILTHRSDRLDQSGGYGEAEGFPHAHDTATIPRLGCRMCAEPTSEGIDRCLAIRTRRRRRISSGVT